MMFVKSALWVLIAAGVTSRARGFLLPREEQASFVNPNDDPFYQVPANVATYQPGQIIARREVSSRQAGANLAASYQVLYRTANASGNPSATVGTILVPSKPDPKTKIFSYQFYEDSVQLDCAPSYALVQGSNSTNVVTAALDTPFFLDWALSQGYYGRCFAMRRCEFI